MKCKLCGDDFSEQDLSLEHYPAHSVGNDDIVQLDIAAMMDTFLDEKIAQEVTERASKGESFESIAGDIFDNRLSKSIYPKGRAAKTLCRDCNTFLGKYDEAYLKFYNLDGDCKRFKGYQQKTRIEVIKSIYGKFLSVPETAGEKFDFIDFLRNRESESYSGIWKLYMVKRDFSTDLLGLKSLETGKVEFDEGVVYELSDDKFIFNLMNFTKHDCFEMTDIFEILNQTYNIVQGVGENGGYHASILMTSLFSQMITEDDM